MSAIPSDPPRDGDVDAGWDLDEPPVSGSPGSSPTRGGTAQWGDSIVEAVEENRARMRSAPQPTSPVRGGTRPWEDLLPPAVRARYRAVAAAARKRASAVRGPTRRWEDMATFVRQEIDAAKRAATDKGEVDPLDDLPVEDILAMMQLEEQEAGPASQQRPRSSAPDADDDAPSIDVHGEELWDGEDLDK